MSQRDDSGFKTFEAGEAIPQYARVFLESTGVVTKAGLAEKEIGTALKAVFAAGEMVPVKLRSAAGTHKMIMSEAAAIGATVYTESEGEVQDTAAQTAFQVGQIVDIVAPTADQNIVEVLYNNHGDTPVP